VENPLILHLFTPAAQASPFDVNMAYDAGYEAVVPYAGVTLADVHADPDHHRAVFTLLGDPTAVGTAAHALADVVLAEIDMRGHRGMHPRIGALDVLPFVPLDEVTMSETVTLAHDVGRALAEVGAALSRTDGTVDRVDVHPVDLERVFIHLTGRALRD